MLAVRLRFWAPVILKGSPDLTAVETRGAATMEIGEEMQLVCGDTQVMMYD